MICFHHQENRVVQSCKNIVYHNIDVGLKDKKKKNFKWPLVFICPNYVFPWSMSQLLSSYQASLYKAPDYI